MTGSLRDKVAIVTGAASGIGAQIARTFIAEGARVVVGDRDYEGAKQVAGTLAAAGGEAIAVAIDVTSERDSAAIVSRTISTFGRLDVAVNSAGIHGSQIGMAGKRITDWEEEAFDAVVDVNLGGIFRCMRFQLEPLVRQKSGSIINVASIGAFVGLRGSAAYIASKHAAVGLTRSAAVEYAGSNVRINALCPGVISTPLGERALAAHPAALTDRIPMRRLGTPEEVAALAVFLACDASAYLTGGCYVADGGYLSV